MKWWLLVLTTLLLASCATKAEHDTYGDVLRGLAQNGHPSGMFGATWFMTQQEVWSLFNDARLSDAQTLVQARSLYDRPIEASYQFEGDRLYVIVVSFQDEFGSLNELVDAFYQIQSDLYPTYGQMPEPILHDLLPRTEGRLADQDFIESTKIMGRTTLIHRITITNDIAGEQILMFLTDDVT